MAAISAARLIANSREFRVGQNVGYVGGLAFQEDAPGNRSASGHDRILLGKLLEFIGMAAAFGQPQHVAGGPPYVDGVGIAEVHRGFDQRIEDGLQIEDRIADDLQHLRGRGLLSQGLVQFPGETLDPRFSAADGGTALGLRTFTGLSRQYLAPWRLSRFAASSGTRPHCFPQRAQNRRWNGSDTTWKVSGVG